MLGLGLSVPAELIITLHCGVSTDLLRARAGALLVIISIWTLLLHCFSLVSIRTIHLLLHSRLHSTVSTRLSIKMTGNLPLPEKYDDLPDKRRYWPAPAGSEEEGLGMLRLLTPEVVAEAARTQIQTGERVCLNWDIENLSPPGKQSDLCGIQQGGNTHVVPTQASDASHSSTASNGSPRESPSTTSTTSTRNNPHNGTVSATTTPQLQHQKTPPDESSTVGQPPKKS